MSNDLQICLTILDEAIAFEEEGQCFFIEREKAAPSELERSIFHSLAIDEAGHKAYLVRMRNDLAKSGDVERLASDPNDAHHSARAVFTAAMESAENPESYEADELKILQGALEVERRGYRMYRKAADQVTSEKARAVFEDLAAQEQNHYRLLSNTLDYLTDPQAFHAFDEDTMLDGG